MCVCVCVCVLGRVQESLKNNVINSTLEKRPERAPFSIFKNISTALTGLAQRAGRCPANQKGLSSFLVRAEHVPGVLGQVPCWGHVRGSQSMFLLCIDVSLSLSLFCPLSLKINKIFKN